LFMRRKRKLRADLGELEDERESLSSFLRSKLKVDVTSSGNKVLVDSENVSSKELKRLVNKSLAANLLRCPSFIPYASEIPVENREGLLVSLVRF